MEKKEFKPQRGYGQFYGEIVGLDRNKENYEGTTSEKKAYKSIRFNIKVVEDEMIPVELFGMKQKEVYTYDQDKKKTSKVKWVDRNNAKGLIGVTYTNGSDSDGKNINVVSVPWDAITDIVDNYNDGNVVSVNAELKHSEYNGMPQTKYSIQKLYKSKNEIDFEKEDYVPLRGFKQTFILESVEKSENYDDLYEVNGYVIVNKDGSNNPIKLYISEEKYPKGLKGLKKLKEGAELVVEGQVHVKPQLEEIDNDNDGDDDDFGTSEDHVEMKQSVGGSIRQLIITRIFGTELVKDKFDMEELEEIRLANTAKKEDKKSVSKSKTKSSTTTVKKTTKREVEDELSDINIDDLELDLDKNEDNNKKSIDLSEEDLPF